MKKTTLFLISILSLSLASCSFVKDIKTEGKEVSVYDIDKIADQDSLDNAYQDKLDLRFVPDEEYIPYMSLEQYASLFTPHYVEGARNEFKSDNRSTSWYIYVGEDLYFYTYISVTQKYILKAGDIENVFAADDNPRDLKAMNLGMNSEGDFLLFGGRQYSRFSFSNCDFNCFTYNDSYYLPLGFYDTAFSESAGMYFFYNYNHIYSTRDVENYATKTFKTDAGLTTVDKEMEVSVSNKTMPYYLVSYNADLFVFLMDNFYGLKSLKGISSMTKYYQNQGYYNGLYSSDSLARSKAYTNAIHCFDDNHTVLVSVNKTWGESVSGGYGRGVVARSTLRTELRRIRQDYYTSYFGHEEDEGGNIIYSDNGKTAMFHFETFAFGETSQVFNEDESIKEDAYKYDTYLNFIRIFNEIKQKGTVKNVVIDVSTNGGGVVGVMMKLLALVSKNNSSTVCICDESYLGISRFNTKVDVDLDGSYTESEVFGDDFNIYILTSDCSFSAGNAFPCYAKQLGVKIIGEKSGGGECAVAIHYLPNSQYVYHSSNLHLGYIDEETYDFVGLENGAPVDIDFTNNTPLSYVDNNNQLVLTIPQDFYDINAIDTKIANYKS